MPYIKRFVEPVALCRLGSEVGAKDKGLDALSTTETLEVFANAALANTLLQIACLWGHAQCIFAELQEQTEAFSERAKRLNGRVKQLTEVADTLTMDSHVRDSVELPFEHEQEIVTPSTRPLSVRHLYSLARSPPNLHQFNKYGPKGGAVEKQYSDPSYFQERWLAQVREEINQYRAALTEKRERVDEMTPKAHEYTFSEVPTDGRHVAGRIIAYSSAQIIDDNKDGGGGKKSSKKKKTLKSKKTREKTHKKSPSEASNFSQKSEQSVASTSSSASANDDNGGENAVAECTKAQDKINDGNQDDTKSPQHDEHNLSKIHFRKKKSRFFHGESKFINKIRDTKSKVLDSLDTADVDVEVKHKPKPPASLLNSAAGYFPPPPDFLLDSADHSSKSQSDITDSVSNDSVTKCISRKCSTTEDHSSDAAASILPKHIVTDSNDDQDIKNHRQVSTLSQNEEEPLYINLPLGASEISSRPPLSPDVLAEATQAKSDDNASFPPPGMAQFPAPPSQLPPDEKSGDSGDVGLTASTRMSQFPAPPPPPDEDTSDVGLVASTRMSQFPAPPPPPDEDSIDVGLDASTRMSQFPAPPPPPDENSSDVGLAASTRMSQFPAPPPPSDEDKSDVGLAASTQVAQFPAPPPQPDEDSNGVGLAASTQVAQCPAPPPQMPAGENLNGDESYSASLHVAPTVTSLSVPNQAAPPPPAPLPPPIFTSAAEVVKTEIRTSKKNDARKRVQSTFLHDGEENKPQLRQKARPNISPLLQDIRARDKKLRHVSIIHGHRKHKHKATGVEAILSKLMDMRRDAIDPGTDSFSDADYDEDEWE
ncbi:actin-binding protein WASF2-like [Mya arenaria]|uniref:actin-binding protein WASF2-like n=1 Tax=Mya arenaria TaxID=6604 RepID=UPI0022DEC2EC|nr:actin-binding protein WASF2-like [Mya arenaria]